DLEEWVPHPDSISQAKLYLYHYRGDNYTGIRTINVYALTTAFLESTTTWNTPWITPGGDYDNAISSSADIPEAWENWVFWDVTEILKNRWNDIANHGFLIKDPVEGSPGPDGPYEWFYSHRCLNDTNTSNDFAPYLEIIVGISSAVNIAEENYPRGFSLMQNFPNPFNGETVLQFDLPRTSKVSMVIYNLLGERVKTLLNESRPAGMNAIVWDGTDQWGKPVSSGMYFYQLSTENYTRTKRLLYLK
ncbi:MAG TPA: DNRLRE domain-containing protein, partial [candidate division Zixibacteria bacterium]